MRGERRDRTVTGLAIPYQCPQWRLMRNLTRNRAFAKLTLFWALLEVPRGCNVGLPPVFRCCMAQLMDPRSGHWVVA